VEVAKKKALAKIDSMLGSLDVKRTEIKLSVDALEEGVNGLRKAKIKAQVKHDQLEQKVAPITERIADIDQSLKRLRDHLASGKSVEIAGNDYSAEELKQMADKVLNARKELVSRQEGFQKSKESLQKVVATLEQKQQEYEQRLSRLESQIAEIDSKRIALKAMQDASAAMGESEATLANNVEDLEDKVNDLFADVEGELLAEDEKWDATTVDREIDAVDAFVSATQDPADTLSEIDSILGTPDEPTE
ncbi:MAG: hypothetical protein KDA52_19690, partial [Planctomycetaceae bacterium]|nr:hypothetical protein [Planctomycetaceae bacterium]